MLLLPIDCMNPFTELYIVSHNVSPSVFRTNDWLITTTGTIFEEESLKYFIIIIIIITVCLLFHLFKWQRWNLWLQPVNRGSSKSFGLSRLWFQQAEVIMCCALFSVRWFDLSSVIKLFVVMCCFWNITHCCYGILTHLNKLFNTAGLYCQNYWSWNKGTHYFRLHISCNNSQFIHSYIMCIHFHSFTY